MEHSLTREQLNKEPLRRHTQVGEHIEELALVGLEYKIDLFLSPQVENNSQVIQDLGAKIKTKCGCRLLS